MKQIMKLHNQTIRIALGIISFVGMIIGDICEGKYLMYICGFMCFFFFTGLYVDYIQRVKNELGIIKNKKEINQYGYKETTTFEVFIFIGGCFLSVLLCKLNIHYCFLILLGVLLGIEKRFSNS